MWSNGEGGIPHGTIEAGSRFGSSVASIGDVTGDGMIDAAVGAPGDGTIGSHGAVMVCILAPDDTVSRFQWVRPAAASSGPGPGLVIRSFGSSVTAMQYIGSAEQCKVHLIIGADDSRSDTADASHGTGALVLVQLATGDGSEPGGIHAIQGTTIGDGIGGLEAGLLRANYHLGRSLSVLGDIDGDGTVEILAGAPGWSGTSGTELRGALLLLSLSTPEDSAGSKCLLRMVIRPPTPSP